MAETMSKSEMKRGEKKNKLNNLFLTTVRCCLHCTKSALEVKGILPLAYTHLDPGGAFHFQHDAANWYFPQDVRSPLLSSSACVYGGF